MISDNSYVRFEIVDCSLYTRRFALNDVYHKKRVDMLAYSTVEYKHLEILARTSIIPARQNQFNQENIFNNAPNRRVAIAMKTHSASLVLLVKTHSGNNHLISDKLEYSEGDSQIFISILLTIVVYTWLQLKQ